MPVSADGDAMFIIELLHTIHTVSLAAFPMTIDYDDMRDALFHLFDINERAAYFDAFSFHFVIRQVYYFDGSGATTRHGRLMDWIAQRED